MGTHGRETMKRNTLFAYLDGREYTLDDVHGTFEHSGVWPREQLYHNPTAKGKRTKAYREKRRQLEDDWCSNLTEAIDRYCAIARELGYTEESLTTHRREATP